MSDPRMPTRLAIFTSALGGGGVQRSMRNLAVGLVAAGYVVDLLVCHGDRGLAETLQAQGVNVQVLHRSTLPGLARLRALRADPAGWRALGPTVLWPIKTWQKLAYIAALRDYLAQERPAALLSAMTQCNLVAFWAHRLATSPTRLVVSERNMLSPFIARHRKKSRWRHIAPLVRRAYAQADAVVAVSDAVADDLARATGLARSAIATAPNPVVDSELRQAAAQPARHAWFHDGGPPVVLGVGRLVDQKDPMTLLAAFAALRADRRLRLMLIGDGPLRSTLSERARALGVADDVALPGWDDSPFAAMAAAAVFVLPSRWEGLPGVLIQALACGCPVIATDCPGGSREILANGRFGQLVPVGDYPAMAQAIARALATPDEARTRQHRAETYSIDNAARCYARLMLGR